MRGDIEAREPERDPALAAALGEAYATEPLGPERAAALRARIRERAQALRAEPDRATVQLPWRRAPRRARRSLWLGFRRPAWAMPALLAATIAAVLLFGRRDRGPGPVAPAQAPAVPSASRTVGFSSAEQALSADVSDAEFARVLTGEEDPAALLAIAVGGADATRTRN